MENPFKGDSHINPQKEDGHREIETSILQALIGAGLSGLEYALVLHLIDKTWGWNKKEDLISLSQFHEATGHDQGYIARSLKNLEKKQIIIVKHGGGRGRLSTYMFNKYWDTWIPKDRETVSISHPLETPVNSDNESHFMPTNSDNESHFKAGNSDQKEGNSDQSGVGNVDYKSLTIDNIDTYNRKKSINTPSSEALELSKFLKGLILRNNAKAKTPDDLTKWAAEIDRMQKIDHRTLEEIKSIIEFSQNDSFWRANILSAGKLREKFDQLYLKAEEKEKVSAEKKEKGGRHAGREQPGRGYGAHSGGTGEGARFSGFRAIGSGPEEPAED